MASTVDNHPRSGQRSRGQHLALALRAVAESPTPPSRADLAAVLGVTRATASSLVATLVSGGLLVDTGERSGNPRGRPGTGVALASTGLAGVGLEVNVDYLAVAVTDLTSTVRHRIITSGDQRGRETGAVLADLGRLAAAAVEEARQQRLDPVGAVLAVPGLVGTDGILRVAPNLGWRETDLLGPLHAEPVLARLELGCANEADLAALAELATGDHGPTFLHVSGEIGVGAGLVVQGDLLRGQHGWSGELGHVPVEPDGPRCACGSRGCLELYAGQEAILRAAGLPVDVGTGLSDRPTAERLVDLARAGDPSLLAALDRAGRALGSALTGALNLLDFDTVVLGGLYRALAPWLVDPLQDHLRRSTVTGRFVRPQVRPGSLGADAAVVGAAGQVVRQVLADPARHLARD